MKKIIYSIIRYINTEKDHLWCYKHTLKMKKNAQNYVKKGGERDGLSTCR